MDENGKGIESTGTHCDVDTRLQKMEAFQEELVKQVEELKNELKRERDARKAVEKRLEAAEEKLNRAAIVNENGRDNRTQSPDVTREGVLAKKGTGLAQRLAKGVGYLRELSPKVQIVVCTVLPEEAKPVAAAEVQEKVKSGKYIPPSMQEDANRRGESMAQSRTRDEVTTIRVTNLSEDVRNSDLYELFRPFGQIAKVYLAKHKVTGQSKGVAFIRFVHREDAARAIANVNNGFGLEWAKSSGTA
ncbi:eukaryotic translation initiation factor 3 subunit G-like [Dermacentor albipictus]|uniref:eukaryotic translation initiation factor 3 subunit G-like n=1 Tax=Dermacentor albipictus TaxID=60249 RepID=UPI0038FC72CA